MIIHEQAPMYQHHIHSKTGINSWLCKAAAILGLGCTHSDWGGVISFDKLPFCHIYYSCTYIEYKGFDITRLYINGNSMYSSVISGRSENITINK